MNILTDPKFHESLKEEGARLEGLREYAKMREEWELASLIVDAESKILEVRAELIRRASE